MGGGTKWATLVLSLNTKQVPVLPGDKIRYMPMQSFAQVSDDMFIGNVEDCAITHVVGAHRFSQRIDDGVSPWWAGAEIETTYIAYSEDVQRLLELPFDLISESRDQAQAKNAKLQGRIEDIKTCSFWQRLRFLFSGSIDDLWRSRDG